MHASVPPAKRRPRYVVPALIVAGVLVIGGTTAAIAYAATQRVNTGAQTQPVAEDTPTPTPTPSASNPANALTDYHAFCEANSAAAAAKRGTVAEDLAATREQAKQIRVLMPMKDVPPEVAAGSETFVKATDELIGILAGLPGSQMVADVPIETFTDTQAMQAVGTDANYQAFIGWTIETCGMGVAGE